MTATCVHNYTAFITCDGNGMPSSSLVLGPETVQASALAYIDAHGAVCTGLGDVASGILPTCQARVFENYSWQDV